MLALHLLEISNMLHTFHLPHTQVLSFFSEIEAGYPTANPYHNSIHAAGAPVLTKPCLAQSRGLL